MAKKPAPAQKYKSEFVEQGRKLAELGLTDQQMSEVFGVRRSSLNLWKAKYPEFAAALTLGKEKADELVERSLYQRATGYSHDAVKIFCDPKTGAREIVAYTEHYAPDTTACIFWLKNRRPDEWRDVKAVEHSRTVRHRHADELTDEEIIARLDELQRKRPAADAAEASPGTKRAEGVH